MDIFHTCTIPDLSVLLAPLEEELSHRFILTLTRTFLVSCMLCQFSSVGGLVDNFILCSDNEFVTFLKVTLPFVESILKEYIASLLLTHRFVIFSAITYWRSLQAISLLTGPKWDSIHRICKLNAPSQLDLCTTISPLYSKHPACHMA